MEYIVERMGGIESRRGRREKRKREATFQIYKYQVYRTTTK
jgi:hypothetical protein